VTEPTTTLPPGAKIVPPPSPRRRRAVIAFAVAGVMLAIASGGLYLYRARPHAPTGPATPEEAVKRFLTGVFLTADPDDLKDVVCQSWEPGAAFYRTRELAGSASNVGWERVAVISNMDGRAAVSARVRVTVTEAASQWRFAVNDQDGWRVCEARPFVS
jgi:hypothetical protein